MGLIERFAKCFEDKRDPDLIEHTVKTLARQRVLGLALGYEDVIDHDQLRLWFASMAYVLLNRLREVALAGTELANATVGSIRLKLLKIGA